MSTADLAGPSARQERTVKGLSVKQAAEWLGVSCQLVYDLCAARKIRHERHGMRRGRIKIPEDALEEYRESCTVGVAGRTTTPPPPRRGRPSEPVTLKFINLPD